MAEGSMVDDGAYAVEMDPTGELGWLVHRPCGRRWGPERWGDVAGGPWLLHMVDVHDQLCPAGRAHRVLT